MKRKLLLFAALLLTLGSQAQKGQSGLGLTVGYSHGLDFLNDYEPEAFMLTLRYQYGLSDRFEIEPSVSYSLVDSSEHGYHGYGEPLKLQWGVGLDLRAFILKDTRLRPYVSAGVHGYGVKFPSATRLADEAHYQFGVLVPATYETIGGKSGFKPSGRLAVGGDFRLFYHSDLMLEAGLDTFAGITISFGYMYKF